MRDRLASETTMERETRLHQMRVDQCTRLASEITEEREARLQQMSVDQRKRLASETLVEREARLQQMSVFQHDRLVSKTIEEREVWLQSCRDRLRQLQVVQSRLPLFEQHYFHTNMLGFHATMIWPH